MATDPALLTDRSPGRSSLDDGAQVDMIRLRSYRLRRLQDQLVKRDYGGILVYDPVNIRYATGVRNMQLYTMHVQNRSAFVPAEGPAVVYEFDGCEHLARGLETVGDVRPAMARNFPSTGSAERGEAITRRWAEEIAALMRQHSGNNRRLAIDGHVDALGADALRASGLELFDGQEPLMLAKAIKSADEIACVRGAVAVCEAAMSEVRTALRPGISENELWAILNKVNHDRGGEYIETRLLSSGERTNPWYQEASERVVRPGELVAFDTDMIGPHGYFADISRTYFCGPGRPTIEQREIYKFAYEQVHHNIDLIRPGRSFREFSEKSYRLPETFKPRSIGGVVHGAGMYGEWPKLYTHDRFESDGYDGEFAEGMILCVESYVGRVGGSDGVKLEQEILVTANGVDLLSTFPFDDELLR